NLLRRQPKDLGYARFALRGDLPEVRPRPPRWMPLPRRRRADAPQSVQELRATLDRLAADPRARGAIFDLTDFRAGPATIQAVRQEWARLGRAGKEAIAYLPGGGTWHYYLASGASAVAMPEGATLNAVGLRLEAYFLGDLLATLGLQAEFEAVGRYKVSPEQLSRSHISPAHQEMLEDLLESLHAELTIEMAEGRRMTRPQLHEALDACPLTAEEARQMGLVDACVPPHRVAQWLAEDGEPEPPVRPWGQVRRALRHRLRWRAAQRVGVVPIEGTLVVGESGTVPLPLPFARNWVGHETIVRCLRKAAEDKRIGAVVLLINSPGGAALAADLLWEEVRRLDEEKPVVACLQDQATSGGYYVATAARAIVAQPVTLTGSIGIFGGKVVDASLLQRLRVGRYAASRGRHANIYASAAPFTPAERARIRALLEEGYQRFLLRVAEGRKQTPQQVEEVAEGRVWTGRQAHERGLVDHLGGLREAVQRAAELAGIPPHLEPQVVLVQPGRPFRLPLDAWGAEDLLDPLAALHQHLARLFAQPALALCPWLFRIADVP
ncbi:MAG: signal peptide peptidase SppA, partial [Anaerolineae bacterium]|nr:signal peptide peptidase SppA [Anaerolineae bacterium]